ncbi:nucleotide exchange factor GrpE [bacterium]|nr:nucleotide exchange factor GrpE [bacterium]
MSKKKREAKAVRGSTEETASVSEVSQSSEPKGAAVDAGELGALKVEELSAKWLRALADLDNYKKRVQRERILWDRSAREEVLIPILEVIDNFERAIYGDAPAEGDAFRDGVELIFRHFMDVLEKGGVTPIETEGRDFDPNLHEAVGHVESDGHKTDQIVQEMQKGYMLGDRLLRPARVVVAK